VYVWNLPESRHCYDGVPEGRGNTTEIGVLDILFGIVHDGGENDDGHGEREEHEAQLADTRLQGHAQDSETGRMA